jgi:CelD/BcsL family acetyltransferase involved in cellulose biosynthesis
MRIAERFLKLDLLRLYVLEVDGLIAALLYCYKYKDGLFYYQSGFDLEFAKYSLGTVAFAYAIQDAISEHIKRFDFLRGFHDYKYHWANADRLTVGVTVRRGTFAGRAYFVDVFWRRKTKDYLRENLPARVVDLLRSVRQSYR